MGQSPGVMRNLDLTLSVHRGALKSVWYDLGTAKEYQDVMRKLMFYNDHQ